MAVGNIDRGEVAMVQGNPVGLRFSFGDGGESVDEYGVVLTDDQCRGARIKSRQQPERPGPLTHNAISGAVKTLMFSAGDMLVGSSPLMFPRLYPRSPNEAAAAQPELAGANIGLDQDGRAEIGCNLRCYTGQRQKLGFFKWLRVP